VRDGVNARRADRDARGRGARVVTDVARGGVRTGLTLGSMSPDVR
jgi:hypothetical protein